MWLFSCFFVLFCSCILLERPLLLLNGSFHCRIRRRKQQQSYSRLPIRRTLYKADTHPGNERFSTVTDLYKADKHEKAANFQEFFPGSLIEDNKLSPLYLTPTFNLIQRSILWCWKHELNAVLSERVFYSLHCHFWVQNTYVPKIENLYKVDISLKRTLLTIPKVSTLERVDSTSCALFAEKCFQVTLTVFLK